MIDVPWLTILAILYGLWVVVACGTLLMSRRSPHATLAWIFAFIALPFVSGLYYLVFGPRRLQRRRRRDGVARAMAASVSQYLRQTAGPHRPALSKAAQGLAAVGKRLGQGMPTFASSVQLFDEGVACFAALALAIEAAKHHLHLEYYIWEPDHTGTDMRDRLVDAVRRGVEVRVLYDAVGSPNVKTAFWRPLVEAGGEVLPFNPVRISVASIHFANFRTHRKIVVADGRLGFLGGINIHDSETSKHAGAEAWHDQHTRIEGEPVRKIQRLFLENWTYAGGSFRLTPESVPMYFPSMAKAVEGGIPTQILHSGPDDETAPLHAFFLAAIASARDRVWIETPYLIPDEPLESALRIAHLRDVDVQVIVPHEGDSKVVAAASRTYCDALARAGIVVFEYGPPMLHAKTMIIDDTVAMVGTANMDNRSFRLNFEVAAAFYDAGVIDRLAQRFQADRAMSRPLSTRRRGPRLKQVLESIARLTSPVL